MAPFLNIRKFAVTPPIFNAIIINFGYVAMKIWKIIDKKPQFKVLFE